MSAARIMLDLLKGFYILDCISSTPACLPAACLPACVIFDGITNIVVVAQLGERSLLTTGVRIQPYQSFKKKTYFLFIVKKTKIKRNRPGMAHFKALRISWRPASCWQV